MRAPVLQKLYTTAVSLLTTFLANRSPATYEQLARLSLADPNHFWAEVAQTELEWFSPFSQALTGAAPNYQWFADGMLNISHNCLDRHLQRGNSDRVAYHYHNELNQERSITYAQLLEEVCQAAHGLEQLGVQTGDRVIIYMPLCIEQVVLMLACARMGAVHCVVYAGFSAAALKTRIVDTQAKVVCTADWTQRSGKRHNLREVVLVATQDTPSVTDLVTLERDPSLKRLPNERTYLQLLKSQPTTYEPKPLPASHPLFILYTSGTTGTPKGIVHALGGYSVYSHFTAKVNLELTPADTLFCTADTGWITGHSYGVYGPLSNGVTCILYEGSPLYPHPAVWWKLIEQYHATQFYTSPTAIRSLMREGTTHPAKHDLCSLRLIGSVGEPLNPAAWEWYAEHIGRNSATVIDTWWQTETGGHLLGGLPFLEQKPGIVGQPFFGISPLLLDERDNRISQPNQPGELVLTQPWPGALADCWQNRSRFDQYWNAYPPHRYFYTGDLALYDEAGNFRILGRGDDVINVSGVRVGSAEVENALVAHPAVAEAAAIGLPHEIKGESIAAFVILHKDITWSKKLARELQQQVATQISSYAKPEIITPVEKLPKTRSGKIMRRVLKAQTQGLPSGDTSTLED